MTQINNNRMAPAKKAISGVKHVEKPLLSVDLNNVVTKFEQKGAKKIHHIQYCDDGEFKKLDARIDCVLYCKNGQDSGIGVHFAPTNGNEPRTTLSLTHPGIGVKFGGDGKKNDLASAIFFVLDEYKDDANTKTALAAIKKLNQLDIKYRKEMIDFYADDADEDKIKYGYKQMVNFWFAKDKDTGKRAEVGKVFLNLALNELVEYLDEADTLAVKARIDDGEKLDGISFGKEGRAIRKTVTTSFIRVKNGNLANMEPMSYADAVSKVKNGAQVMVSVSFTAIYNIDFKLTVPMYMKHLAVVKEGTEFVREFAAPAWQVSLPTEEDRPSAEDEAKLIADTEREYAAQRAAEEAAIRAAEAGWISKKKATVDIETESEQESVPPKKKTKVPSDDEDDVPVKKKKKA
jgi:hypothetical protein